MRILLTAANLCTDPYPVYPLGMSVIAKVLTDAGHTVRQFDALANGLESLPEKIRSFRPDAIGISIRNLDTVNSRSPEKDLLKTPLRLIGICRAETGVPLFLGGPGYSLLPEKILDLTGADYGIAGEGEAATLELIRELESGGRPAPRIRRGTPGRQSAALYDDKILAWYQRETHIIPVQTKRGCPFRCTYCTYPLLEGHSIRERGNDAVLDQLCELRQTWPDSMFYFVDATFNDPAKEYRSLLERMRKRGIRIPFAAFLSPSGIDSGDIELLYECGMIAAELGIDAAADETLRGIGKNFTFAEAADVCRGLLHTGTGVTTNVMFGGPGETEETIRRGIGNLRSLEPAHTLIFSGIRIFPGTPLYRTALRENKIPDGWDGVRELYYFADGLDPERVHQMLSDGFRGSRFCIYPPDSKNRELQALHRIGYARLRRLNSGETP